MMYNINLNGESVQYELQRKPVKNINLRVKPDGMVYISANNSISTETIESFLNEKSAFILNALRRYKEFQRYAPKPKQYIDGESFKIYGHDLRLKVFQGEKNAVDCDGVFIKLTVKNTDDIELKKKVTDKWIRCQFESTVNKICREIYPKFQKYGVQFPKIRFRRMVSRWGSCQPKSGCVTFNIALAEVPMSCIEYVAVHEFTHFLQPNHSNKFYTQLTMFMPDWGERKKLLEKYGICIL